MDLNDFFYKSLKKCSIHTPYIRKQPQTCFCLFVCLFVVVVVVVVVFLFFFWGGGHPENVKVIFCVQFLKILMVSDKTIHRAIRIHKTLKEETP